VTEPTPSIVSLNGRFFVVLRACGPGEAAGVCAESGGELAELDSVNVNDVRFAGTPRVQASTVPGTVNPSAWIRSWNGDPFANTGLAIDLVTREVLTVADPKSYSLPPLGTFPEGFVRR
jgi:hypothetical protein